MINTSNKMQQLSLSVNGAQREILVEPASTLLVVLRESLGLIGTKCGCEQGSCGACTVLLDNEPVLSCITPAMRCQNRSVITIEGLTETGAASDLQNRMVEFGGIQCGFCTPGMVITLYAFLNHNPSPTEREIREAISGNLCRCTGYSSIVRATMKVARGEEQV